MTTSRKRIGSIGTVALLVIVAVSVAAGPVAALSDASPATTASAAELVDETDADAPEAVGVGESFTVDATAISQRDGVADVCWTFDEESACHDAKTTRTFEDAGPHTATLFVTDENGERDSHTTLIYASTPPDAALAASGQVDAGATIELDASGSTDDDAIDSYEWDLTGDGAVDETTTDPVLEHAFDDEGQHDVTVTVVDAAGQRDAATATVDVAENEEQNGDENEGQNGDENEDEGSQTQEGADGGSVVSALIGIAMVVVGAIVAGTLLAVRYRG